MTKLYLLFDLQVHLTDVSKSRNPTTMMYFSRACQKLFERQRANKIRQQNM